MTDFPFDTETTPYAVVTARHNGGFAHLNLCIRGLPGLGRSFSQPAMSVSFTNQASGGSVNRDSEPFYAWRLGVDSDTAQPIQLEQLQAACKVLAKLQRDIAKIDAVAGAPADTVDAYIARILRAAKVAHVYVEPKANHGGRIPDWDYFTDGRMESLNSQLRYLRRALLQAVEGVSIT